MYETVQITSKNILEKLQIYPTKQKILSKEKEKLLDHKPINNG